jgi:hypothetical protein
MYASLTLPQRTQPEVVPPELPLPDVTLPDVTLLDATLPELATPRLATVPDAGPPYDCEIHGTACQAPVARSYPDPLNVAMAAPVTPVSEGPARAGSSPACTVAVWPRQFAQAIVESLAGTRPLRQILPWVTERAQAHIRSLVPLLRTDSRPRIQRILTSQPDSSVVEVTVIAGFGPRTRALALRFEHVAARPAAPGLPPRPARWLCTDIETG